MSNHVHRRQQTFGVLVWATLIPICSILFGLLFLNTYTIPLALAYILFVFIDRAPSTGGRRLDWIRDLRFWKWQREYFPGRVIVDNEDAWKSEMIPESTNEQDQKHEEQRYLFGLHPHGVISVSMWLNLTSPLNKLFPLLSPHIRLCTVSFNFVIPIFREIILGMGFVSASRHSCERWLKSGTRNSLVIAIGGAAESLYAMPGTNDLILKKRLGFVKLAIKNGVPLVPIFAFGENDLYEQISTDSSPKLRQCQQFIKNLLGYTIPIFYGRGIFNYDLGLLPRRVELVTVIGNPIYVTQNDTPSHEEMIQVQVKYIAELERIYHKYKDQYDKNRVRDMRIVE